MNSFTASAADSGNNNGGGGGGGGGGGSSTLTPEPEVKQTPQTPKTAPIISPAAIPEIPTEKMEEAKQK